MLSAPATLYIELHGSSVHLTGDLDMETADSLVAAAEQVMRKGHHDVTIDCDGLTFCDSYGLRALQAVASLVEPDGSVSISRPTPTLTRILDISGIADSFTIVDGEVGPNVDPASPT